jgi:hypothetical protein
MAGEALLPDKPAQTMIEELEESLEGQPAPAGLQGRVCAFFARRPSQAAR